MNSMMNKSFSKLKGMLSMPDQQDQQTGPPPQSGTASAATNSTQNSQSHQPNGNIFQASSSTSTPTPTTSSTARTTPLVMPTKISSYTPSSTYKPVPIRPEVINTTAEINSLSDLTNVTSKFLNQNLTQLNAFSSKGISFIKSNVLEKINSAENGGGGSGGGPNSPKTTSSSASTSSRPSFVRQQTMSVPTTPKAGARMSRQESLLKSAFSLTSAGKAHLKATNSLPTPGSASSVSSASKTSAVQSPSSQPPLNLAEFRIKLAQVRALENVNRLTDVNSITSATYVTATASLVPNGAALAVTAPSSSSRRASTVSNLGASSEADAPTLSTTTVQQPLTNICTPVKSSPNTTTTSSSNADVPRVSASANATPIPLIEITENSRAPSPLPIESATETPCPPPSFPVFTFSKTLEKASSSSDKPSSSFALPPNRPTTLLLLKSLSSFAEHSCDTPSPRSPLSQANYLAPKASTKLDLSQLDLSKLDLHLICPDEAAADVESSDTHSPGSIRAPPKIKPPVLTLSDIHLEVRIHSIEKILLSLMQKVSESFFIIYFLKNLI